MTVQAGGSHHRFGCSCDSHRRPGAPKGREFRGLVNRALASVRYSTPRYREGVAVDGASARSYREHYGLDPQSDTACSYW